MIQIRVKNKNGKRSKYADNMFETLALIKSYTGITHRACGRIVRSILRDDVSDQITPPYAER